MTQFAAYAALGIGPGQTPAQAPVRNYTLVAEPTSTIAAGGTSTVRVRTDGQTPFVVAGLIGSAKLGATLGSSVAGVPLANRTDPDNTANTMAFTNNVRYEISTSEVPLQQAPQKLGKLCKPDGSAYVLAVPFVIAPASEITIKFYNDHATASITPRIELEGYFDPRTA